MIKKKSEPFAVVDIGSNSVRLVIYESVSRTPDMLYNEKYSCKLGKLDDDGYLRESSKQKAEEALTRFRLLLASFNVKNPVVLATAALRDAKDGAAFADILAARLGKPVQVISGEKEAVLAALGVAFGDPDAEGIVADLGGGSLELARLTPAADGFSVTNCISNPIGILKLQNYAEEKGGFKACETYVREIFKPLSYQADTLHVVGGSWRALGLYRLYQQKFPLHIIHGYSLTRDEVVKFCKSLENQTLDPTDRPPSVSRRRFLSLPFAALTLRQLVERFDFREVRFSANGLREGALFEALSVTERKKKPLENLGKSVASRAARRGVLAEPLAEALLTLFPDICEGEARLIRLFAYYSDIAWRRHPDYRSAYAFNAGAYGGFYGVSHQERLYLAIAGAARNDEHFYPEPRFVKAVTVPDLIPRALKIGVAARLCYAASLYSLDYMAQIRFVRFKDPEMKKEKILPEPEGLFHNETARKLLKKLNAL